MSHDLLLISLLTLVLPVLVSFLVAAEGPMKKYPDTKVGGLINRLPGAERELVQELAASVVVAVEQQYGGQAGVAKKVMIISIPCRIVAARFPKFYGVPTMFIAELEHPDFVKYDLSSLRTGVMAGSPCPAEVMRQVIDKMHMREVEICYGMTETSPVSFQSRVSDSIERRVSTVGQVHPHVEVKIVDPATGQVVPTGMPGELLTRGYSVMLGYWANEEATRIAIDPARWMHTGDLATMDEEGYVNIVGRLKDMVIRGGENIYPREVEEFLYSHPKVSDVQVIGVPDARYGEELMAWVRVKEGQSVTPEEMEQFCRGQIATFKIPRYWKFVDSFPMTVTGKIQKFIMRQQAINELGLQVAANTQTA